MEDSRNKSFLLVLAFVLCPILSFFMGLNELKARSRSGILVVSLCFGLFAFLTPPVTDLYRHTLDYYSFRGVSLYSFYSEYRSFDFAIPFLSWFLSNSYIPYVFLRFVLFTITTYMHLSLFFNYIECNGDYDDSQYNIRLWTEILLAFSISTIIGVRWGISLAFFRYGAYYYIEENRKGVSCFLFLVSALIHFSMLPFIASICIVSFVPIKKTVFPFCVLACYLLSLTVAGYLENYLLARDIYGADFVGNGQWGNGESEISFNGLVFKYLVRILQVPYLLFFWIKYDSNTTWTKWIGATVLLVATFYPYGVITSRTIGLFSALLFIYFLSTELNNGVYNKFAKAFLCCAIISVCSTLYQYRKMFYIADYEYLALPAPFAIDHDYDLLWINTNLDFNGEVK